MAPALFDWVEFWVELQEEKNWKAMFLAAHLKCRLDSDEIRLVEEELMATAVNVILRTLKVLALRIEPCLLKKSSLHEDHHHTLENASLWVPTWEVERLWLAIREHPISHPNPLLLLLSIRAIDRVASFICCINFHKPICFLLRLLEIWFWCVLGHMSSGEGTWWSFRMDGGVVENENVVVVGIVFLKDIHCIVDLSQNIFIGEVPLSVCSRPEEYSSQLCSIRGVQPAIVGRNKI